MYFAAGSQAFRPQPVIFALFSCPETEIEDDIRSQFQRSAGDIPEHRLDKTMSGIVFWLVRILAKKTNLPLIGRQSNCRPFVFKLLCKRCFP
jgi:hypothetical protein